MLITLIGLLAAALTSLSYIPQVKKALPRGSTGDLSLKTLGALAIGLGLWIVYGVLQKDVVIVCANAIGVSLVVALIAFKLRDSRGAEAAASEWSKNAAKGTGQKFRASWLKPSRTTRSCVRLRKQR